MYIYFLNLYLYHFISTFNCTHIMYKLLPILQVHYFYVFSGIRNGTLSFTNETKISQALKFRMLTWATRLDGWPYWSPLPSDVCTWIQTLCCLPWEPWNPYKDGTRTSEMKKQPKQLGKAEQEIYFSGCLCCYDMIWNGMEWNECRNEWMTELMDGWIS